MANQKPNYIKQPLYRFCWHCQIKIIHEYINKDIRPLDYKHYSPSFRSRSGFIWPQNMKRKLIDLWLQVDNIEPNKSEHISDIKKEIDDGKLVLMTIWHWYIWHKHYFNSLKWIMFQHWISIWSYDENGVYIYDSSCFDYIDHPIWNLYISWKIFDKSYDFAISKVILSIWSDNIWSL